MKTIKCLVWDLDHTLWDGTLLEDPQVSLKAHVEGVLTKLDERGILLSIASKNHFQDVQSRLEELGLWGYFLYPEVHWNPKSQSIRQIAENLNIGLDSIAFMDDQDFELQEVQYALPQVRCYRAEDLNTLLALPEFSPTVTPEARTRRALYRSEEQRKGAEQQFSGTSAEFLRTLDMHFTLFTPEFADLERAEELTVRTHQLNTTGYTYALQELDQMRKSADHLVHLARLEDRFGTYGTIGLGVVEKQREVWTIKLLLMSCRVMSRGVGNVMLTHLMQEARRAGVKLQAEFKPNDRNRMMQVTYRFAGFVPVEKRGDIEILQHDLHGDLRQPDHLTVHIHTLQEA
ncbi:HAD-IIIC family phosphatase [Deinococcus roseus]|uniref:N-acetyltransferase domain-containing protein n=1 Tax=Deinococcus roseus TaxID=392414 RepID=A0ABQ2DBR3_9DEIO|nr:HAD-IIIC family phosphatase [Deinococcus roseus]GGJ52743.1 hypothetical protein GCM10008938_43380 [Deinococcus roseus]